LRQATCNQRPDSPLGDDGQHSGWSEENSVLAIRTSLWNGQEQKPKTLSSIREVDLSKPVNAMLAAYVKATSKTPGSYLFSTRNGTPLCPTTLRKYALAPLGIPGFHSLRRWRVSYLKSIGTPDSLLKTWIGHSLNGNDITARYDKSADDKLWRQEWANKVGIGFDLPTFESGPPAPSPTKTSKMSKRKRNQTPLSLLEDDVVTTPYVSVDSDLPEIFFDAPASPEAV
jgi:hypothetical protein